MLSLLTNPPDLTPALSAIPKIEFLLREQKTTTENATTNKEQDHNHCAR